MSTIPTSPQNMTPPATPPMSRQPAPARRKTRRWTLVLAGATGLIFAMLLLARYASAPDEDAAAVDQPDRLEQAAAAAPDVQPVPAPPASEAKPVARIAIAAPVVTKRPKKAATVTPAENRVAASAKSTAPIAATAIAKAPAKGNAAAPTAQARFVSTESVGPAPVTLTGCLEVSVDRDEFRLSDPEGADAPRARSWRTGFLKKRPTPVALVEPPDPHGLQIQVGKRVAATGTLIDRELKVSSVAVVGASCD
jgi:hypothetical protein